MHLEGRIAHPGVGPGRPPFGDFTGTVGLDMAEERRLLDQRISFEVNY